jgi:MFS family permease
MIAPALAGAIAAATNWRVAFFVLFVPILATSVVAARLKEPKRGATDPDGGVISETALPPKFREASKTLWRIKTLRRSFIAAIFLGAGFIPLVAYVALYFEKVFELGPFARGAIGSVSAFFVYLGTDAGGKKTAGWFAKGMGEPVKKIAYVLAIVGIGLVLFALAPTLWLALPLAMGINYTLGFFGAPLAAIQALVSPARERSLAFSFGAIFLVGGVLIFGALGLATVADDHGLRWGIGILAPWWIVGGAVAYTAHKFVADDVQAAMLKSAEEAEAVRAEFEAHKANEEEDPAST